MNALMLSWLDMHAPPAWLGSLAWRPFLDPMPLDHYWLVLLLPLVLSIAVVYKAIKLDDLAKLPRQSLLLAGQILGFMFAAAAVLAFITWLA